MSRAAPSLWQRLCYTRMTDVLRGRFDASLRWQTVLTDAELPAEVSAAVEQVVRRTRLWRSEKVDVAQELVAHFQDGLDAGRTPEQLVESFGDPGLAAQLIRRAKRRGRSLVWHVAAWTGRAAIVFVAVYAILTVYYLMGRPSPHINYLTHLNEHAHSVPRDQQAWPIYRQALLALGCQSEAKKSTPATLARDARPGDSSWPQAAQFLSEHAEAFAQLREAAARPHLGYEIGHSVAVEDQPLLGLSSSRPVNRNVPHPPLFEVLLPHLQALRAGAQLLETDVYRAVEAEDANTAHADVMALLRMSQQIGESPFIVGGLVGLAVGQRACHAIEFLMTRQPQLFSDHQLADLAHQVAAQHYDAAAWLDSERIAQHDFIQRIYTDDGHGDGSVTYAGLKYLNDFTSGSEEYLPGEENTPLHNRAIAMGMPIAASIMCSRKELEQKIDEFFALAKDDLSKPLWNEDRYSAEREVYKIDRSPLLKVKYLLIALLMPATSAMGDAVERTRGMREGVLVGIALELYHRAHNAWPSTLEELVPRFLPQIPVDRINGGPLGYRIVDDRPLVYSFGDDTDDDGGRLPEDCHGDRWRYNVGPPSSQGTDGDWVIWSTVRSEVQETGEHP